MLIVMAKPLAKLLLRLRPKRRWAQFSLGTTLLLVTVLCLGLRVWAVPAEGQRGPTPASFAEV
jgi:hypothetical protein